LTNCSECELKISFPNQVDSARSFVPYIGFDAEIPVEFIFDSHTSETRGAKSHAIGHEYVAGDIFSQCKRARTPVFFARIDPDFIRLRTLAIPNRVELHQQYQAGDFKKCTDVEMAEEIALFIAGLDGINSVVKSDHILNLFQEVEGRLPADRERMLAVLNTFLEMPPQQQALYQAGRRVGIFSQLRDLENSQLKARAENMCAEYGITADNVDAVIDEIMKRFI